MQTKKFLILFILKVLETESDPRNPMSQTVLAEYISQKYPCDRKTVGRNIKCLKEAGIPIVKTSKGYYLDKKRFTVDEIKFVKDAVLQSNGKTEAEKADIADRLTKQ